MRNLACFVTPAMRALWIAFAIALSFAILAGAFVLGLALNDYRRAAWANAGSAASASPSLAVATPRPFVPWSPARPAPSPTPPPTPSPLVLRYCGASDLVAEHGVGAAAGTTYSVLLLANRSATPCQLHGRPPVAALDAGGRMLPLRQELMTWGAATLPVLLEPEHDFVSPKYERAGEGRLNIGWRIRCDEHVRPATLLVSLADGSALRVEVGDLHLVGHAGICSAEPSRIGVSAFEPRLYPPAPTPTPPPLVLRASIEAPASVRSDRPLRYFVTLTNATSAVFRFGECPVYAQQFVKNFRRYYLNCEGVGPLAPRASMTFEMVLALDPRLTPDETGWDLRWWLEPFPNSAEASARVEVTLPAPTRSPAPKPTGAAAPR